MAISLRAACLALPLLATPAFAQPASGAGGSSTMPADQGTSPGTAMAPAGGGQVSAADRRFIDKAAVSGLAEVQAAQLAEQTSSDATIKDFAQKMITDHTKLNQDLTSAAQAQGVTPPTALNAHYQSQITKLQGMTGGKFDRAYLKGQVRDHDQAIKLFQTEANDSQNPQLKQLAQQSLPVLQQHLDMAKTDMSNMGK